MFKATSNILGDKTCITHDGHHYIPNSLQWRMLVECDGCLSSETKLLVVYTAPQVTAVTPSIAYVGSTITVMGNRFASWPDFSQCSNFGLKLIFAKVPRGSLTFFNSTCEVVASCPKSQRLFFNLCLNRYGGQNCPCALVVYCSSLNKKFT